MSHIEKAKFISAPPEWGERVPKFKKEFKRRGTVLRAKLEISALGVYEAMLNGVRVGDFIMAPGWTEYEKRIQYQTYDVSDLLKDDNVLTVGVGHGWFCSNVGSAGKYPLSPYPALIASLYIEYENGDAQNIVTDESWSAAKSETLYSTIYGGETADGRITPEFNTSARIFDYDTKKLFPTEGEYVREIERLAAKKLIITPKGERVIDFGQNLTGYVEMRLCGKAGDKISLSTAEILDGDGNFYNKNYRAARSLTEYILKGGEETFKPKYTFFGFRYIKVDTSMDIDPDNFTAIVLHSDMKRTGYFTSGNEKINKLYKNVIWGQRGNFLDIPTDCPQRDERLGWTGDVQVFCRTAMLNFDCRNFFKKWLRDLALCQYEDGAVPRVVPNVVNENTDASPKSPERRHSSAWGDVATVCPFEYYMAYGDVGFLREMFPVMKKWVGFIESASENGLWNSGFHFGDWLALDNAADKCGATDKHLIATAFYFHSVGLTAKTARILGEDSSHYDALLPKIKKAFRESFIKGSRMTSDTQTAYVLALHFDLAEDSERDALKNRLIELIESRSDTLTTGFVGTPFLLDTLCEVGRSDKAYTLLLQEKFPSWLYSVNMGATTIWEHWDGINENGEIWSENMNSFNHYAYGSVASWLYRTVCGIKYDEFAPGYKHFYIEPLPSVLLGSAKARLLTDFGEIVSEWKCDTGGKISYYFEIPEGTCATVTLDGITKEYKAGKYSFR